MMGGRIWVESEEGQGSRFHFTARFALAQSPQPESRAPLEAQLEDLHVLVVDDNATNRFILGEFLNRWGCKPASAESGEAALLTLQLAADAGEPFSLILTDAQMPGMDGFALVEHIQRHPLSGSNAFRTATDLEEVVRSGNLTSAPEVYRALEQDVALFREALQKVVAEADKAGS
jgi:CheY-like chemotaxis protein